MMSSDRAHRFLHHAQQKLARFNKGLKCGCGPEQITIGDFRVDKIELAFGNGG